MADFTFHQAADAPAAARPLLNRVQNAFGFIPNLFGYMAAAPATMEAYLSLMKLVENTSFTPIQQQLAMLAASVENDCEFCTVAHRALAKMKGAPASSVEAIVHGGDIDDAADQALVKLVRSLVRQRGRVSEAELEAFVQAGFALPQVLELMLIVTIKTLSNYTNHLTRPEPNEELLAML